MDEIHEYFTTNPTRRLQLLTFLNLYISQPSFSSTAPILASHPLMTSILSSLQLDNSSTTCTIAVALLVKLLPVFAVEAGDNLKDMIPRMLAILARLICWKERPPLAPSTSVSAERISVAEEIAETALSGALEQGRTLSIKANLGWKRLEYTFKSTRSCAPPPHQFFTFLYYLFPCNTIRFLRQPTQYLAEKSVPSPYTIDWEEALDEAQIKSRSEVCA